MPYMSPLESEMAKQSTPMQEDDEVNQQQSPPISKKKGQKERKRDPAIFYLVFAIRSHHPSAWRTRSSVIP